MGFSRNLAPLEDFALATATFGLDIRVTTTHVLVRGETYPYPKNSPVSATAQTTRNQYAAVGPPGCPESSADANQIYPLVRFPCFAGFTRCKQWYARKPVTYTLLPCPATHRMPYLAGCVILDHLIYTTIELYNIIVSVSSTSLRNFQSHIWRAQPHCVMCETCQHSDIISAGYWTPFVSKEAQP